MFTVDVKQQQQQQRRTEETAEGKQLENNIQHVCCTERLLSL